MPKLAITGCQQCSEGKKISIKFIWKKHLNDCAKVFREIDSSSQAIITKGIRFLLVVDGAPEKIDCISADI